MAYPGAQSSAVGGLIDLFQTANMLAVERGAADPALRASKIESTEGLQEGDGPFAALILPPSLATDSSTVERAELAQWITARYGEGTVLCSVCAGAFLLGQTGLLAGRAATTHWIFAEKFSERFPDINVDVDKLIIDDGDIITAGGLMAWTDLGLRLIERFVGSAVMLATARFFLVDPSGREQRFYSSFAPKLTHGDAAVLKAQHWLQGRSGEKISLPMMAEQAGLGERTFMRRFHKATGLKPTEYLQHLRVGKARDMLESSTVSVDQVAWQVGYEDPGAFRKVFQKVMGLTPGEYRRRFAITET